MLCNTIIKLLTNLYDERGIMRMRSVKLIEASKKYAGNGLSKEMLDKLAAAQTRSLANFPQSAFGRLARVKGKEIHLRVPVAASDTSNAQYNIAEDVRIEKLMAACRCSEG